MKKTFATIFTTVFAITLIFSVVQFQGKVVAQQATPTSAPSKTPTIIPTVSQNDQVATQPPAIETKTQADLSIVTGNIQRPNGLTWFNDKLYTACTGDWTVYEIDTQSGTTTQYIYGVRNAHSLYVKQENDHLQLWIPDFQNNNLVHIYQGTSETIASDLQGPWGITEIQDNVFAVTNLASNNVLSITEDGTTREIIANLRSPAGITTDGESIYVANTGSARRAIEWFNLEDTLNGEEPIDAENVTDHSLLMGVQNITNLTLGADNELYFSYALGTRGVVGKIDPQVCREKGGCTSEDVEVVLYTELAAPLAGLTLSPDMRLYIHSIFSPDIYWVQLDADENQ